MTESDQVRLPISTLEGEEEISTYNTTNERLDYEIQPHRRIKKPMLSQNQRNLLIVVAVVIVAFLLGLVIGLVASRGGKSNNNQPSVEPHRKSDEEISKLLLDEIQPDNMKKYLKDLTAKPHLAGKSGDKQQARELAKFWRDLGLTAHIHKYKVHLSYPDLQNPNTISLYDGQGNLIHRTLPKEKVIDDKKSRDDVVPPFHAYSAPGIPKTNRLVYVNYARAEDFEWLISSSSVTNLTGSIAIARYGKIFRGDKVKFAELYGCIGIILYTDPQDYSPENTTGYPTDWWMPSTGVQRGSILIGAGDPATPGYPALDSAYRLPDSEQGLPGIPSHPISYGDAYHFLSAMSGDPAPADWQGNLNITYKLGPGFIDSNWTVQMNVSTKAKYEDTYNVMAVVPGDVEPDRWVLLGNHRDAWVYGAVDPSSGTAALMETSRAYAKLIKTGWRPRRSIMFLSWGAEEFSLIGSYEWVEQYLKSVTNRVVAYLNVDIAVQGTYSLRASASPILYDALFDATKRVANPNNKEISSGRPTVYDTWLNSFKDNNYNRPYVRKLGTGSDFAIFQARQGVSCIDFRYTYNANKYKLSSYPIYHSAYETFDYVARLLDPTFKYHAAVSSVWAEVARNLADSPVLPFAVSTYGLTVRQYFDEFVKETSQLMTKHNIKDEIAFLGTATVRFKNSTESFQKRISEVDIKNVLQMRQLNDQMIQLERAFTDPNGLPGRPLYNHVIYAPSSRNSYAGSSFPGLSDTIYDLQRCKPNCQTAVAAVKKQLSALSYIIQGAASVLDPTSDFPDATSL